MLTETDDRRRNRRYKGKNYPLSMNGVAGELVDWSAGGLGILIENSIEKFSEGESVRLSIKSEDGHDVISFFAFILRLDKKKKIISIEFKRDADQNEVLQIINFISCVTD